jgi:hypothetical protein
MVDKGSRQAKKRSRGAVGETQVQKGGEDPESLEILPQQT